MHSLFKICISQNMKFDKMVGFLKYSHIYSLVAKVSVHVRVYNYNYNHVAHLLSTVTITSGSSRLDIQGAMPQKIC